MRAKMTVSGDVSVGKFVAFSFIIAAALNIGAISTFGAPLAANSLGDMLRDLFGPPAPLQVNTSEPNAALPPPAPPVGLPVEGYCCIREKLDKSCMSKVSKEACQEDNGLFYEADPLNEKQQLQACIDKCSAPDVSPSPISPTPGGILPSGLVPVDQPTPSKDEPPAKLLDALAPFPDTMTVGELKGILFQQINAAVIEPVMVVPQQ